MVTSHKILIILVILIIVIFITNSQSSTNSKSSKKEPFLQPGGSYCWNTINSQLPFECMGGYNYNSSTNECNPPPGPKLPAYNWSALSTYTPSELDGFLYANRIPPNSPNCTTLTQNEVNTAISNAKSRNGSFTQAECNILWPGSVASSSWNYGSVDHCLIANMEYPNNCRDGFTNDLNTGKCYMGLLVPFT